MKEAVRSCSVCGGIDVFRYHTEPIVEGTAVGRALGAASTPELAHIRYELEREIQKRREAEEKLERLTKVVTTMEVNQQVLIQGLSHVSNHLAKTEDAIRGATLALLPTLWGCGHATDGEGAYGEFEGVVRPSHPAPQSPESIRVFPNEPTFSSPTLSSSSVHSPIPSLISDNDPSSASILSEGEELWTELSRWWKGGEEERPALSSISEINSRSVEIIEGGTDGGSISGGSIGFETEYFGDSEGEL